jgi:hypothetical protein
MLFHFNYSIVVPNGNHYVLNVYPKILRQEL